MTEVLPNSWLKEYYRHLYPVKSVIRWLSYGKKPSEYLQRREIAFILKDDVHLRFLNFTEPGDMKRELERTLPHKVDIGAVYNACPRDKLKYGKNFRAEERELVFDIDLTDYDDIRTCCSQANVCQACWRFMSLAARVLDTLLREHFGFNNIMYLFSGRRGIHCWVADEAARKLDNSGRAAVAEYLSVTVGSKKVALTGDYIHPMFQTAYASLMSSPDLTPLILSQKWLETPKAWTQILELCNDLHFRTLLHNQFTSLPSAEARWKLLKRYFDENERRAVAESGSALPREPPKSVRRFLKNFVLHYTYPRLDINVTTGTNHLLKSPFCVHPKTGIVAVPLSAEQVPRMVISSLPTISKLMDELKALTATEDAENAGCKKLYYKHCSLAPFVETFDAFVESAVKNR